MDETRKVVELTKGQPMVFPKPARYFTSSKKELFIQEYLTTSSSENKIPLKYLGTRNHGRLLVLMRKWGYHATSSTKTSPNLA
jgi:hypothetical protein